MFIRRVHYWDFGKDGLPILERATTVFDKHLLDCRSRLDLLYHLRHPRERPVLINDRIQTEQLFGLGQGTEAAKMSTLGIVMCQERGMNGAPQNEWCTPSVALFM